MSFEIDMEEDDIAFGASKRGEVFVYCKSHLRPHRTGWCTVPIEQKIKLDSITEAEAVKECLARGFEIWSNGFAKRA